MGTFGSLCIVYIHILKAMKNQRGTRTLGNRNFFVEDGLERGKPEAKSPWRCTLDEGDMFGGWPIIWCPIPQYYPNFCAIKVFSLLISRFIIIITNFDCACKKIQIWAQHYAYFTLDLFHKDAFIV